jgi:hypothetical protein
LKARRWRKKPQLDYGNSRRPMKGAARSDFKRLTGYSNSALRILMVALG